MKQATPNLEYYGPYSDLFRSQVRQIIVWGYQDALDKIRFRDKKHQEEPSITGFIVAAIKDRRRATKRPKWLKYYTVQDDPPVEGKGKAGRNRFRVDIIIETSWKGCPEYMFEAKRLRKNGYGIAKYVGPDGMGCFIQELYAERYDEAAMLGYVQSDSLEFWKEKIKLEIEAQGLELQLKSPQTDVQFLNSFPLEWISKHHRTHLGRPILIFHILLDCRLVN